MSQSQARLLIAGGSVDIANEIDELIVKLKVEHPGISYLDLTNALIAAYCPLVSGIPSLSSQPEVESLAEIRGAPPSKAKLGDHAAQILNPRPCAACADVYRALRVMADHAGQTPSELMAALLTKAAVHFANQVRLMGNELMASSFEG